jgi:hypothetical protein
MDFVVFNAPAHPALMTWQSEINSESEIARIPPCLLAAIIWRETGGTNEYQIGMPHAPGCGVGLTQITEGVNWSNPDDPTLHGYRLMKPADNLYVAAAYFLAPLISDAVRAQRDRAQAFAIACRGQDVFAVAAGYNSGWGAVMRAMDASVDADHFTTNNYASDVLSKYAVLVADSHATQH